MFYRVLADVVAGIHVAWVMAVVMGLLFILVGAGCGWGWVRNRWIRGVHMAMIALVIARVFLWSQECPLTTWERELRELGGQDNYEGSPVGWFLHQLIHPPLALWVFPVVYSAFGVLVVATFWFVPVRWRPEQPRDSFSCQPTSSP